MNIFNKFEAIGIFLSIAIMAVALSVIRFNTDTLAEDAGNVTEVGTVVASIQDTKETTADTKLQGVKEALMDATTYSGELVKLVIDDVTVGTGALVKNGDTVTVHYQGTLQDGTKFDSSYERGQPFSFKVGEGRVIQGWEKGLIGMQVGGKRILAIPSDMAYGNRQVGPIPPNAPLIFSIELLKVE